MCVNDLTVFELSLIVVMLVMALLIYIGKGDWLIAGYNTATKEEKAKYDIGKLRVLFCTLLVLLAVLVFVWYSWAKAVVYSSVFSGGVIVLCMVVVILANTWAKKH